MNEVLSVYQLITRLCSSLIKESDEFVDVNSAKKIAFEALLKSNIREIPESEKLIQELQFSSFELSLANRHKEAERVNEFIEDVKASESVELISWCLIHLKNIDPNPDEHQVKITLNSFSTRNIQLSSFLETAKLLQNPVKLSAVAMQEKRLLAS